MPDTALWNLSAHLIARIQPFGAGIKDADARNPFAIRLSVLTAISTNS